MFPHEYGISYSCAIIECMLDEPITTYDGTGVHEHTLDELRGMDMNAFKTCININNKHIDDFMLMPITVYPASESTVMYVD